MNRILSAASASVLGAAGALAAVGLMTATPAQAFPGCIPNIACDVVDDAIDLPGNIAQQPGQFVENLANQPNEFVMGNCGTFPDGCADLDPAHPGLVNQPTQFLTGNCTGLFTADEACPANRHVGLLNQPAEFVTNLAGQPARFATNLAGQPGRFAESIARSLGAFGPDMD